MAIMGSIMGSSFGRQPQSGMAYPLSRPMPPMPNMNIPQLTAAPQRLGMAPQPQQQGDPNQQGPMPNGGGMGGGGDFWDNILHNHPNVRADGGGSAPGMGGDAGGSGILNSIMKMLGGGGMGGGGMGGAGGGSFDFSSIAKFLPMIMGAGG